MTQWIVFFFFRHPNWRNLMSVLFCLMPVTRVGSPNSWLGIWIYQTVPISPKQLLIPIPRKQLLLSLKIAMWNQQMKFQIHHFDHTINRHTSLRLVTCFEVQCAAHSTYKGCNTYKALVGISPSGVPTFISELYEGSISRHNSEFFYA